MSVDINVVNGNDTALWATFVLWNADDRCFCNGCFCVIIITIGFNIIFKCQVHVDSSFNSLRMYTILTIEKDIEQNIHEQCHHGFVLNVM